MLTVFEEEFTVSQIVGLLGIDRITRLQLSLTGQDILKVDFPRSFKIENHVTDSHTHITLSIFFWLAWVLIKTFWFFNTELILIEVDYLFESHKIFESIQLHHYWEHYVWFIYWLIIKRKDHSFEVVASHFRLLEVHILDLGEKLEVWPRQKLFTMINVSGTVKALVTFPLFEYFPLLLLFNLFINILKLRFHFSNLWC